MNTTNNTMKTNTEVSTSSETTTALAQPGRGGRRTAGGLKVLVTILSLTALALAYRAADEAVALYGVLDKIQASLAFEQSMKEQAAANRQISETNPAIAGL